MSSALVPRIDHVTPRALGGSGEAENLRAFCRAHNHHAAERVFGRAHVEARIRNLRERPSLRGDRGTPFSGPADFSQRKLEPSHVAREQTHDDDAWNHVRAALLTLGSRGVEADRALLMIDRTECDEPWRRPIETLVREALGILT